MDAQTKSFLSYMYYYFEDNILVKISIKQYLTNQPAILTPKEIKEILIKDNVNYYMFFETLDKLIDTEDKIIDISK